MVFSEYLENEEAMVRSARYKLIVCTGRRLREDGYRTAEPWRLPGPYERLYDDGCRPGRDDGPEPGPRPCFDQGRSPASGCSSG